MEEGSFPAKSDSARSISPSRRQLSLLVGFLIVVMGAGALRMAGSAKSEQIAQISAIEAEIVDGQLIATVSVTNSDSIRHELEIWLTLGRFGAGNAWDRRVSQASSQHTALRSGGDAALTWNEAAAVPAGSYEVTAWARLDGRDGQVIQRTSADTLEMAISSPLSRLNSQSESTRLGELSLDVTGGAFATMRGSVIFDTSTSPTLKIDIVDAEDTEPWWSRTAIHSFVSESEMTDDVYSEAVIEHMAFLAPGDYRVRVEALYGSVQLDQVLLSEPLTIDRGDSSIRRSDLPTGAIAILAATTSQDWSIPANRILNIEVQNLGPDPVDATFWWLMAAPGEPQPWKFTEGRSFEVNRRLEPFEHRNIRLRLMGEVSDGTGFELSAWTHVVDDSGETQHSDGVRLTDLINTTSVSGNGN